MLWDVRVVAFSPSGTVDRGVVRAVYLQDILLRQELQVDAVHYERHSRVACQIPTAFVHAEDPTAVPLLQIWDPLRASRDDSFKVDERCTSIRFCSG